MAGHSQFKNIMHRKGKQDKIRAKNFSKLSREITVAARSGLPDPAANSRLRLAIQNARAENLPKDNVDRAVKKAIGGDADTYEDVRYEGYGPGGVALIVEALTDNRTAPPPTCAPRSPRTAAIWARAARSATGSSEIGRASCRERVSVLV